MTTSRSNHSIYLVQPKFPPSYWGLEHFLPLTPYRGVFPPLGLLTLAALTPPEFRVDALRRERRRARSTTTPTPRSSASPGTSSR